MSIHLLTITLDGLPFIRHHLPEFEKLSGMGIDWTWHIVHGAAMNGGSTKWCKPQAPRLSIDGTTEYLDGIRSHPRVRIYEASRWGSKDDMVNAPLGTMPDCLLMQIDSDEIWGACDIQRVEALFNSNPNATRAYFACNYFVGPDIVATGKNCWSNQREEWLRAWRYRRGQRFTAHEPPVLDGNRGDFISKQFTSIMGIKFDHMAYVTESQVRFKELFYGYKGALENWKRLQNHPGPWPIQLKDFLPWVDAGTRATKITPEFPDGNA